MHDDEFPHLPLPVKALGGRRELPYPAPSLPGGEGRALITPVQGAESGSVIVVVEQLPDGPSVAASVADLHDRLAAMLHPCSRLYLVEFWPVGSGLVDAANYMQVLVHPGIDRAQQIFPTDADDPRRDEHERFHDELVRTLAAVNVHLP